MMQRSIFQLISQNRGTSLHDWPTPLHSLQYTFLNSHNHPTVPAMFKFPFPQNNNFIGRRDILAKIEAAIRKNQKADECVPIVLKGLGGMGKSQLMLKYCYTHRKEYKYVFWLNAEGRLATLEEFQDLAEDLGIKTDNDRALPKRIRTWFQSREERWLLLLDNVDAFEDVN